MSAGWNCTVVASGGDIALEQLDDAGHEWLAIGPGGDAAGHLADVIATTASKGADPAWVQAVICALRRELIVGDRRAGLLVKRGEGVWFHATFSSNRESIRRYGLDWRLMSDQGIAGSTAPEWPGIFLCASLEDVRFFVMIGSRRGPIDVWAVELAGQWLEGAPSSNGGSGDDWMICPEPIGPRNIRLIEQDLTGS